MIKRAMLRPALVSAILLSGAVSSADLCENWFKQKKIKPGTNCLIECATLPVGMGTFDCPNACPSFCDVSLKTDLFFSLSELYPRLNEGERALAAQNPAVAVKVYLAKGNAEDLCKKEFGDNRKNDPSDACRHFLWAGLMANDIGSDFSTSVFELARTGTWASGNRESDGSLKQ